MLKLAIFLTLIGTSFGLPKRNIAPRLDGRIVGGRDTDIAHHTYQLALLHFEHLICGAVLISPFHALTVAHCVDSGSLNGLAVRAGSSYSTRGGKVMPVDDIIIHAQYEKETLDNDIAVLIVADPIEAGPLIGTATMAPGDRELIPGQLAVVTGWGMLEPDGPVPEILQVVDLPVVGHEACSRIYGSSLIHERVFCAGYEEGGRDACQGDSGGPVMINGLLTGLVSWGVGCARPEYPGVYTSIPAHRGWIGMETGI